MDRKRPSLTEVQLNFHALKDAGIVEQDAERKCYEIKEKVSFSDPHRGVEIAIYPDDHLSIDVMIDYNSKVLGHQYALINTIDDFETEIAMCRTFVFLHEVELLLKHNLIKGGDLNNAIVIMDRQVTQEELDRLAELFHKPKIHVKPEGILNNLDIHFSNEPARHKLLDLIGDFSLIGTSIKGRIVAKRPGHPANTEMAKILRQMIKRDALKGDIPKYDPNIPPLYNINQIKKVLPHRPPFLLIDKVISMDERTVIGVKNVTINEPFFVGHFPDEPVMPGVLQIEAMAQLGGVLVLGTVPDPENYITYFLKIEKVKFKRKVVPGDTLIFKLDLIGDIRHGIATMWAQAFVGETLVCEGEMTAQISKKQSITMISNLAYVHSDAQIGENVIIEPFATVYGDVVIGDGCWIGPHAVIMDGTRLGRNCKVFPNAVIGGIPQDLKFVGEYSTVEVGDNTTFRECVTVNRGTKAKEKTVVGSNCLLMAYSHVGHDCVIGDNVVIVNSVLLAGEVEVGDWAILSGATAVRQFVRIGEHTYIGGCSQVRKDVPPFVKAAREPLSYVGINSVGLRRRNYSNETIYKIQEMYRYIYQSGMNHSTAVKYIEDNMPQTEERDKIIQFIREAKRGIMRGFASVMDKD